MRRLAPALAVLCWLLVLAAPARSATYWVQVNGIAFYTYNTMNALVAAPTGDPVIDPGDTVLWQWGNSGSHDVVSGNLNNGTPDGKFNTNGLRGFNATFTYTTPNAAASYTYFCTPHRQSGMKGTIKATGTANEPPSASLTTNPPQPQPGQTVTMDASASADPEGNLLARYEWDLDNNGIYEITTTVPTTTTTFTAGNHVVGLRVFDGKSAIGQIGQTVTAQFPPPVVTTGSAGAVTQTAATLTGTVNPVGTAATYLFEFGPTTEYGSTTPVTDAGSGSSDVSASAALTSLTPGTTFHYRLVGTNAGSTVQGSDATFTTVSPPPPPPPPPPDTSPPAVTASAPRFASIARGTLALTVTPAEAATLTLTGRITIKGRKAIALKAVRLEAVAGKPAKLVLRMSSKTRAIVRRALAAKKRVRAVLTLKAKDAAGNTKTVTRVVTLKR